LNRLKKEKEERARLDEEEAQGGTDADSVDGERRGMVKKGKKRQRSESESALDEEEAIQRAAAEAEHDGEGDDPDEDDVDLNGMMGPTMADDIDAAADDPKAAQEARKAERLAFQREKRAVTKAMLQPDAGIFEDAEEADFGKHDADWDEEQDPLDTTMVDPTAKDGIFKPDTFEHWDDAESTLQHFSDAYFGADPGLAMLDPVHAKQRIQQWLNTGRDPKEIAWECQVVEAAYRRREYLARESKLETLSDLDEDELEEYYVLDERDKQLRARVWLSQNGRWLEQSKRECGHISVLII
jgi:transcription factor IIIB subunit 2